MSRHNILDLIDDVKMKLTDQEYKNLVENIPDKSSYLVILQRKYSMMQTYEKDDEEYVFSKYLYNVELFFEKYTYCECSTCLKCLLQKSLCLKGLDYVQLLTGFDPKNVDTRKDVIYETVNTPDGKEFEMAFELEHSYDVYLKN